jgi:hypothetical protein
VTEGRPEELAWRGVRAHRGACGERHDPSASDPVCQTPDGFCEATLAPASIETADGACLEVAGASFDYLFYRATMPSTPLPLEVVRAEDGALQVRHRGGAAIPGRLVHVRRSTERAASVGRWVDAPAPHSPPYEVGGDNAPTARPRAACAVRRVESSENRV